MHVLFKKVTAIAFICLILLANIWLVCAFSGFEVPSFVAVLFNVTAFLAITGFVGMKFFREEDRP